MTSKKPMILAVLILAFATVGLAQPIQFSDPKIQEAVEWKLGKSSLNASDLLLLTELNASRQKISSLKGIEYAKNLRKLDLSNNEITDIKELITLTNLEQLELGSNKISDISPLANLTQLTSLNLYANSQIVDISPLSKLNQLDHLWLNINKIRDISPLSNLTKLTVLYISDNQITDISPIVGLTNLTLLYISDNRIQDISAISKMTKLEVLRLDENPIRDLSVVKTLPNLNKFNNRNVEPGFNPSSDRWIVRVIVGTVFGTLVLIYASVLIRRISRKEKIRPIQAFFCILKWIFVVVFTVLLGLGLYFQAPWKVLALILIILCTCTIIPKRQRKWVWLSIVLLLMGLIVWVFLPDNDQDWHPYSIQDELNRFNAKRAVPPEENAATIYSQLLEGYDWRMDRLRPTFLNAEEEENTQSGFWTSKDYPKLAEWMKQHDGLINSLLEACKKPKCYFPATMNIVDTDEIMTRDSAMRAWYLLLIRAANNHVTEGDYDSALKLYSAVLQLGNHCMQHPTKISLMSGIGVYSRVLMRLNDFIVSQSVDSGRLDEIAGAVQELKVDWQSLWPTVIENEILRPKNYFLSHYEVNSKGKIRISRTTNNSLLYELRKVIDIPMEPYSPTYLTIKINKASTIFLWFYLPTTPAKASTIIEKAYKPYFEMAKPDYNWNEEPESQSPWWVKLNYRYMNQWFADTGNRISYRTHEFYVDVDAMKHATQLLVGLKKYYNANNRWPENLNQIQSFTTPENFHDPISNGPFVYKAMDDGFILYSRGRNGIDDQGDRNNRTGHDDRLFWPLPSRIKSKIKPVITPWG